MNGKQIEVKLNPNAKSKAKSIVIQLPPEEPVRPSNEDDNQTPGVRMESSFVIQNTFDSYLQEPSSPSQRSARSYIGQTDIFKFEQNKEDGKKFMDHFLGQSITPNIAKMIGQANKVKSTSKVKKPRKTPSLAKLMKKKQTMLKKKQQSNTNLKRYEGSQKIPLQLKQQNDRQKRHAYFFKKVLQDKGHRQSDILSARKSKLLLQKRTMAGDALKKSMRLSMKSDEDQIKKFTQIQDIADDKHQELEEEEDMIFLNERLCYERSKFIIFPDSQFRSIWDILSFLLILYQSILVPFKLTFEPELPEHFVIFDLFQDCFFLLDIFLNFNTGFYAKGLLVMQRKAIFIDYFQSWLMLDLVACFPYTWVLALVFDVSIADLEDDSAQVLKNPVFKTPRLLRLFKIARMLRMLKLLRVLKVQKFIMKVEEHLVTDLMNLFNTFFFLALKIVFISHWLACFFWTMGKNCMDSNDQCWITESGMQDEGIVFQYLTSLYWAITTMITVGYGDITPMTSYERIYTMVAMSVASGVFSYILNSIGTLVSRYNILASTYKEKMNYVNKFLLHQQIPQELRHKIRRYLEYQWESKKIIKIDEKEVMAMLNENLREKITVYLNGRILQRMVFLEPFGLDMLSELTFYFQRQTYAVDDFIFEEGDDPKFLYSIFQGRVGMIHKTSHTYFLDLKQGANFGEIGFFTDNPRLLSAKSRDYSELYVIEKKDFLRIAEDYIHAIVSQYHLNLVQQAYHTIRSSLIEEENYFVLNTKCYICEKKGHISLTCPYLPSKKGNLRKAYNLLNHKQFAEDTKDQRDLGMLSYSYIYEEDDPQKAPNRRLGDLVQDKQIFASREDTHIVKVKNQVLREAFFNKLDHHCDERQHRVMELVFDDQFKDKTNIMDLVNREIVKKIKQDSAENNDKPYQNNANQPLQVSDSSDDESDEGRDKVSSISPVKQKKVLESKLSMGRQLTQIHEEQEEYADNQDDSSRALKPIKEKKLSFGQQVSEAHDQHQSQVSLIQQISGQQHVPEILTQDVSGDKQHTDSKFKTIENGDRDLSLSLSSQPIINDSRQLIVFGNFTLHSQSQTDYHPVNYSDQSIAFNQEDTYDVMQMPNFYRPQPTATVDESDSTFTKRHSLKLGDKSIHGFNDMSLHLRNRQIATAQDNQQRVKIRHPQNSLQVDEQPAEFHFSDDKQGWLHEQEEEKQRERL